MAFDGSPAMFSFSEPDLEGRVVFHAPDGDLTIRFDWAAIRKLQIQWSTEEDPNAYLAKISHGLDSYNIEDLAEIIAAGTGKTVDEIIEASYPVRKISMAAVLAWSYAWNGGEPPETEDQPEKTQPQRASLLDRARARLGRVFGGATSGS